MEQLSSRDEEREIIIEALDVHKEYNTGTLKVHALKGVSLCIKHGDIVAIMGPSGCGKTTLLTFVWVTHAIEVALQAQRLITMRDGQIETDKSMTEEPHAQQDDSLSSRHTASRMQLSVSSDHMSQRKQIALMLPQRHHVGRRPER